MIVHPNAIAPDPASKKTPAARIDALLAHGIPSFVGIGLLLLLAALVVWRLGLLHPTAVLSTAEGRFTVPDGFASVDHPFHVARAETVRRAVADGRLPRWVGQHQGGYPVEFYPLGVAWLETGIWGLAFGRLPMIAVHKITVGVIFLLPFIAYSLMARRDRWPFGVAVVAAAVHVAVPGAWWHGGYTELVQWGLVANVAANVALLFVLSWLTSYAMSGGRTAAVGAAVAGAFAIYANPRSLVALIVIWVAVAAATVSRPTPDQPRCSTTTGRLALVLGVTTLVAAPELISLIRFADLYDFVRYTSYADLADYGRSAIDAVSPPVFALGIAGVLVGLLVPGRPITRVAALALLLYGGATMMLVVWPGASPLVAGLEVTRLMPFQRFLTIYLAAAALPELLNWLNPRGRRAFKDAMLVVAAVGVLVLHAGPPNVPPPNPAGPAPTTALYPVSTTATGEQVEFEQAIRAADAAAAPGTAILVIGSVLSWHQQLWAPLWTERPLYYDNWLWYWQPDHAGPPGYRFRAGHHYPTPELALAPDYLTRHGIGAVVVTGPVKPVAARSRDLVPIRVGAYDAYTVERPTTSVTFDGSNAIASEVADQRIVAVGASAGGEVLIRRNWFPRWRATIDGRPVQITRTPDGYMSVTAPPGQVRLELRYVVDRFDWLARALCLSGIITIGLIACESRWRRGVVRSG